MGDPIAARSSFLRPFLRTATARIPFSVPIPPFRSRFTLHSTRISPPSLSRLVRRELSTLRLHLLALFPSSPEKPTLLLKISLCLWFRHYAA
ncbi:hypothetical protein V6N13_018966 [Hibiscus sabdariffa]|uniref:Uncharacterized protein n=1 Tax=Hibiscus sabdariffa TaxID=183260 RepID=A0ABR2EKB1_9ROSI